MPTKQQLKDKILKYPATAFQKRVWLAILDIPKGQVRTYKEIAEIVKHPTATRAVANACGRNPFAPHVPCHRVIGGSNIGGYSAQGGSERKLKMLTKEGWTNPNDLPIRYADPYPDS